MGSLCFLAERQEPSRPQTCGFSPSRRPITKASAGNADSNSCWLCSEGETLLPSADLGVGSGSCKNVCPPLDPASCHEDIPSLLSVVLCCLQLNNL